MRFMACLVSFCLAIAPTTSYAQDTSSSAAATVAAVAPAPPAPPSAAFQLPDVGDFLPLHRGTPAPRDGLLVDQAEMLSIVQGYDRLQHLLDAMTQRDLDTCDVRVAMEHAHTAAAEERLTLRDSLWTARQQELVQAVSAAQAAAQHAGERQWYEAPIFWLSIGALIAAVVFIAVTVR